MNDFTGFPHGTLPFLMELTANNNREWFKANEKRYEALVRGPAQAFIRAMAEPLKGMSTFLVADDRKVGGSLMRVHRDTRFAKDKTPYKTNIGIQFRHSAGKDVHAPGVYLHLSLEECFLGFGLWHPEPEPLGLLRLAVAAKWDRWAGILAASGLKSFEQFGEPLTRVPKGFAADHPGAAEIRRRSFISTLKLDAAALESPDAPRVLGAQLVHGRDFMAFLCEALSLPF